MYSDAAIAGVAAKHVEADITAADEREACAQFFTKMHVDPSSAFCEVSRAETDEGGKSYVQDLEPEEAKMAKGDVEEANMDAVEEEAEGAEGSASTEARRRRRERRERRRRRRRRRWRRAARPKSWRMPRRSWRS